VVDNLNIRPGFFVKPDKTLMVIGSLDEVWVEAEVFERQAPLVKTGMPVTMTLNYLPGKTWQGKVDYIYPTLDAKTRTIKVRLRFANAERELKPNMFAQVAIHAQSVKEALLVPREALIRTGNSDRVVLAMGEGRFKSINVTVGRFDNQHAEILLGVEEGESVVTSAQFLIDSESSKSSDFKRMHHGEEAVTGTASAGLADDNTTEHDHEQE
jgi:Cu(I)/Ag(I) efflux system membrane fusion protein